MLRKLFLLNLKSLKWSCKAVKSIFWQLRKASLVSDFWQGVLTKIRPQLFESLVIVCFYVIIWMLDAVIINYSFCIKKSLFRNKRKTKNNVFMSFFHIFLYFQLWELQLRTEKYIFYLYFPTFFERVWKWIAILLFQVIIIVDAQLLIRLTAMHALNNDRTFN